MMKDKVSELIQSIEAAVQSVKADRSQVQEGSWCVLDYDGNPLPGRWATENDAWLHGYTGKYLFSGYGVARLDATGAVEYEA